MKEYNGYRSWNDWNCSLWLSNDESIDKTVRLYKDLGFSNVNIFNMISSLVGDRTPDGAVYTQRALRSYIKEYDE